MPNFRFIKHNFTTPNDPLQRIYNQQNRIMAWRFKFFIVKLGIVAFMILLLVVYFLASSK